MEAQRATAVRCLRTRCARVRDVRIGMPEDVVVMVTRREVRRRIEGVAPTTRADVCDFCVS